VFKKALICFVVFFYISQRAAKVRLYLVVTALISKFTFQHSLMTQLTKSVTFIYETFTVDLLTKVDSRQLQYTFLFLSDTKQVKAKSVDINLKLLLIDNHCQRILLWHAYTM